MVTFIEQVNLSSETEAVKIKPVPYHWTECSE